MHLVYQYGDHIYAHSDDVGDDATHILLHPSQSALLDRFMDKGRDVKVCSISACSGLKLNNPPDVLESMGRVTGWRDVNDMEAVAVRFATLRPDQFRTINGVKTFSGHPAIVGGAPFIFCNRMVTPYFLFLLQEIYDIRRFASPNNPTRYGRLKSYFRLIDTRVLSKILSRTNENKIDLPGVTIYSATVKLDELSRSENRTMLALHSWYDQPFQVFSREDLDRAPESFLFRDALGHFEDNVGAVGEQEATLLSLWFSTLRFLTFLRHTWVAGLSERAFEPEKFFMRRDEVDGFRIFVEEARLR